MQHEVYPDKVAGMASLPLGTVWPSRDEFREFARGQRIVPVTVRLLADQDTPISLYRKLTRADGETGTFLLESAGQGPDARWSIIGVKARASLTERDGTARWSGDVPAGVPVSGEPFEVLRSLADAFQARMHEELPPFTGGLVGYIAYDAVRSFERLPNKPEDEIGVPDMCMLLAEDVAVYDHHDSTVLLVANALNLNGLETGIDEAYDAALERLERMRAQLRASLDTNPVVYRESTAESSSARVTQDEFEAAVRRAIHEIGEGEIFQVVPSQRFTQEAGAQALDVYRVLRRLNPSPYMFLVRAHDADGEAIDIVGSSPETLVQVSGSTVTTHPIAGSRPRGATPDEDARIAAELREDPKDGSEHLMLVDLGRNDLAKVCVPGSVTVRDFKTVVKYSHIQHLVSTVTGTLRKGRTALDAFAATFPAGTLTGAPKPRAMQIIDELEPVARGVYGGTVGYLDFAGNLDMAIAIRTTVMKAGRAHVQAGGGVVADSSPTMEYRESLSKAAAAERAVASAATMEPQ